MTDVVAHVLPGVGAVVGVVVAYGVLHAVFKDRGAGAVRVGTVVNVAPRRTLLLANGWFCSVTRSRSWPRFR